MTLARVTALLFRVQFLVMPEDTITERLSPITLQVFLDAFLFRHSVSQSEDVVILSALLDHSHSLWECEREALDDLS